MTNPASPANPPAASNESPPTARPVVRRKRSSTAIIAVVLVVVIVAAALAVSYQQGWLGNGKTGTSANGCPTGVTLQGNGAQFVNPLLLQWASSYGSSTNNAVDYTDGGSGTGLTDFNSTTIDFAITDEPLSPSTSAALPSPALTIPIVGGALAIIYNLPGVTQQVHLNGTLLADIYLGTITNWNASAIQAANPGVNLPNQTIYTVHRSDPAGTTYVLTDLLSDDSPTWNTTVGTGISIDFPSAPKQIAEKGNSAVLSYVQKNSYTIGYSDLTDVLDSSPVPSYAAIENPAGQWISPTIANTASAIQDKLAHVTLPSSAESWYDVSMVNAPGTSDYPLATFVYLFVYQALDKGFEPSSTKAQVMVQWLNYVLSPSAQAYADDTSGTTPYYYVPLPSTVVAVDQAGVQTLTYNGAPVPACT